METKLIPLDSIKLDPTQPRRIVDERAVENLAKSLKTEGLIHPIEVDKDHRIIVGELRYRAAKKLGWEQIKATVNDGPLPPYERLRRQMAENLQQSGAKGGGQPMNAIDTAKAWVRLYRLKVGKDWSPGTQSREEIYGKFKEIVEEVGVDRHTVYEHLQLLEQPQYVIEDLLKGRPRTLYRKAESIPTKYREKVKRAISEGKISGRADIERFARLAKARPKKAEIEFLRLTEQQNVEANRILNRSVELGLVLTNCQPERFSAQDKLMITSQLKSVIRSIKMFLTKMNKPN